MDLNVKTNYPVRFELIEQAPFEIDNRFRKCKVYICHDGENLNDSIFYEDTLKYMGAYLEGVGIVGFIDVNDLDQEDFRGHEMVLKRENGEFKFEYLCVPFGTILKDNNAKIEELDLDGSGTPKKWLTCEGVLYNRFQKCIDIFERDNMQKSQSMELEESSIQGRFNNKKQFEFEKAKIEFLTILGNDIRPAMSGSHVTMFSSNEFQKSYQTLLSEINESLKTFNLHTNKQKGGEMENMTENKIEQIEEVVEQPVTEFTEEVKPTEEFAREVTTQIDRSTTITETYDDETWKVQEVNVEVRTTEAKEVPDSVDNENSAETFTEEESVVETVTEDQPKEEFTEEVVESVITEKFNVLETEEYKELLEKYSALESELADLKSKFALSEEENTKLKVFKADKLKEERVSKINEIVSKFSVEGIDIESVKSDALEEKITMEQLEEKLFAMVGKKHFTEQIVKGEVNEETLKFSLKSTETCPYPSLAQYFTK